MVRRRNSLIFPWDDWLFSKKPIEAIPGVDFQISIQGFETILRREAKRLKISVHIKRFRKAVWFKFYSGGKDDKQIEATGGDSGKEQAQDEADGSRLGGESRLFT